jgi:DNA (cytosine-5)-methyltransferase 1
MGDVSRPILYDLYSCAGGAARGYMDAGFEVWGIDNRPQPRYCGDRFFQMDAFEFVAACQAGEYPMPDIWHASPPCQRYSRGSKQSHTGHLHPDLIAATREALIATGRPYVIENVADARPWLRSPFLLCGGMFPGLQTYRHRLFECSEWLWPPHHFRHLVKTPRSNVYVPGQFMAVYGHVTPVEKAREVMGIDWPMTQAEVVEAIPPAFTQWIGQALLAELSATERAS